jgi:hypothetical protein
MPVQTLTAATPLSINKVYDKVWVEEIVISALDPNADATARVRLRLFTDADGVRELAPEPILLAVDSLLSNAATDPELDAVVTGLMGYVAKVAASKGIVAAE